MAITAICFVLRLECAIQWVDLQHAPCKWLKTGVVVGGCGWQIVLFASRRRFDLLSSASRRHFVVFSLFSRSVFVRSSIG